MAPRDAGEVAGAAPARCRGGCKLPRPRQPQKHWGDSWSARRGGAIGRRVGDGGVAACVGYGGSAALRRGRWPLESRGGSQEPRGGATIGQIGGEAARRPMLKLRGF